MPSLRSNLGITPTAALAPAALLLALACLTPSAAQAQAKTCTKNPVRARGEPSKFEWIARTKAKANWRAKVRAITGLGDPYANWNRAENQQEECDTGPNGTACELTGIPCKKGPPEQPDK